MQVNVEKLSPVLVEDQIEVPAAQGRSEVAIAASAVLTGQALALSGSGAPPRAHRVRPRDSLAHAE